MKKSNGFTLIELLISIAILAVIAFLITPNLLTSLKKGRDARRKTDLSNIQKALEMYYEDKSKYPDSLTFGSKFCEDTCAAGEKVYMQKLPDDPSSSSDYMYSYCPELDRQSYRLYASLENLNDLQIIDDDNLACVTYLGCGTNHLCNYGISSPNTTPWVE